MNKENDMKPKKTWNFTFQIWFQIAGFCGETEEEFEDTMSLIDIVKYNNLFLFPYSLREVMSQQ